jgi:tetratricopeptide (TPR) repeat protein
MGFDKAKAIRAAEKSLAQGKIPSAIQEYERIVAYDADDFSALNTLGDLYTRVNKKSEAQACYKRVAEHYREQGFTLKAIAMYKKLTRSGDADHRTALSLASLYEQQGLLVEARQQYIAAADAYARTGETREALDILRRIADLDPSNTQIRLRLADGYAREKLPDLAAEAYTDAGERMAARKEFEPALEAFIKALAFRPASHAALHGLLAAHTALGTADEAAEVLEQAVVERPGDLEVRALLARAYVEAEDAERAEHATQELVSRDHSSFTLFFDVIRLYLRAGDTDSAARLLAFVADSALAGRQDATLTELLQEVLARNPEQMQAHNLLVRAYSARHDDARLRSALESLADTAEATGATEDERRALTRLMLFTPVDQRRFERLEELGGPLYDEEGEAARTAATDMPTFERFVVDDSAGAQQTPPPTSASEFEWNSVSESAPAQQHQQQDASASFADLNDLTDESATYAAPAEPPPSFQEMDFGAHTTDEQRHEARDPASAERMLRQELESVDFYIEQGYADIARDTLDMLERQYGPGKAIEARRARIAPGADAAGFDTSTADLGSSSFETPDFEPSTFEPVSFEPSAVEDKATTEATGFTFAETVQAETDDTETPTVAAGTSKVGIDAGLAAIFDEFREAVEEAGDDGAGADFETHYNMGLAYREMGLLDQAVEEFQTAAAMTAQGDGTPRYLQCCNLLGHCFMEKQMPRPAAMWFKKGLSAPGHTEDEYQAMRYDLGTVYEMMGDTERAIEVLSEVYAIDVSYRGVAERLRELQTQKK